MPNAGALTAVRAGDDLTTPSGCAVLMAVAAARSGANTMTHLWPSNGIEQMHMTFVLAYEVCKARIYGTVKSGGHNAGAPNQWMPPLPEKNQSNPI